MERAHLGKGPCPGKSKSEPGAPASWSAAAAAPMNPTAVTTMANESGEDASQASEAADAGEGPSIHHRVTDHQRQKHRQVPHLLRGRPRHLLWWRHQLKKYVKVQRDKSAWRGSHCLGRAHHSSSRSRLQFDEGGPT